MLKKSLRYILLFGIVASLAVFIFLKLTSGTANRIIILPSDYDPFAYYPGYSGLHPSRLKRPAETFSFPVKPGEIGPVQPLFAGPLEYPFLCRSDEAELGQPLVDNQEGAGIKVYAEDTGGNKTDEVIGYSKDCSLKTRVWYIYKRKRSSNFYPLETAGNDIEVITVNGRKVDYILRVEVGTINRHPYLLLALKGDNETPERPDVSNWNKKLVYYFRGGVGIGKRQGKLNLESILEKLEEQLALGYAVIHSTANQTSNHYDIWLAEDTALRVKRQFMALYGEPEYTVGIGGSGGGLQQYLLAQNNPELIDAAIPQYSYPDMVTQTTHVLDCELMEYYFDVTARENPKWSNWSSRQLIEGMNAKDTAFNKFTWIRMAADLVSLKMPHAHLGSSECANAWRGLTPLILNPHYPQLPDSISQHVQSQTRLTYWDNLKYYFGTDERGYARISWGNEGVQYGLRALQQGKISVDEFLHLNHNIGSWKNTQDMQNEYFWFLGRDPDTSAERFSPWSQHNMKLSPDGGVTPAPRMKADPKAIAAAFQSGQVFLGKINIPVIDLRHYLEDELDMHHSIASFQTRLRITEYQGHADNQVIWMTRKPHMPNQLALDVIDQWIKNIKQHPLKTIVENKPATAIDTCFDKHGNIIASGDHVWNGDWNNQVQGECYKIYPPYSTSRIQAGDNIKGDRFSCVLQTIQQAIEKGVYQPVDMQPYQQQLENIFPQGVCDYSQPDPARPLDLLSEKNYAVKTARQ